MTSVPDVGRLLDDENSCVLRIRSDATQPLSKGFRHEYNDGEFLTPDMIAGTHPKVHLSNEWHRSATSGIVGAAWWDGFMMDGADLSILCEPPEYRIMKVGFKAHPSMGTTQGCRPGGQGAGPNGS